MNVPDTWVDMDMVCLAPFDEVPGEYCFSVERREEGGLYPASCVIRCPALSPLMASCSAAAWVEGKGAHWTQLGPKLLKSGIDTMGLARYEVSWSTFCPVNYLGNLHEGPGGEWRQPDTRGIHLWNEIWRQRGLDKDASYPADSIYEQLKREYLR